MKPEQQNIAVAESLGWQLLPAGKDSFGGNYPALANRGHETISQKLLDYVNDLNACYEMEKYLTPEQSGVYEGHLEAIINRDFLAGITCLIFPSWHAEPKHKTEAFLLTVGKWG